MTTRRLGMILFVGLVVVKLALLAWLGPLISPDTPGYTAYADAIAESPAWRVAVDWSSSAAPHITYRMAGYPMLIHLSQWVAGKNWEWLLVAAQLLLAAYATWRLFLLLVRISGSRWLALALALAQATSINLVFDQFVLTDGFNLSLLMLATITTVEIALGDRPTWTRLSVIALGFLGSFLMREATATLMWVWMPLVVLALHRAVPLPKAGALGLAVLAPTLLAKQAYTAWNVARSGERFVTTSYQFVLPQPLVKAYRYDPTIFGGDSVVDRIAREQIKIYHYEEIPEINVRLNLEHGWTAPQLMREMERRFWRSFVEHPRALALGFVERLRFNYAFSLVAPLSSVNFLLTWAQVTDKNPISLLTLRRKIFSEGRVHYLPLLIVDLASRIASVLILVMIVWGLIAALRRWRSALSLPLVPEAIAMAALVGGFFMAHAIVHLEERYLMPLFPIALIQLAIMIRHARILKLPLIGRLS